MTQPISPSPTAPWTSPAENHRGTYTPLDFRGYGLEFVHARYPDRPDHVQPMAPRKAASSAGARAGW